MSDGNPHSNMKRTVRQCVAASIAAVVLMGGWSLLVGAALPPGAEVPIHWNIDGEPDNFAPKGPALALMPATALGISLLLGLIPVIDPRRRHVAQSAEFLRTAWLGTLVLLLALHAAMGLVYLGWAIPIDRVVTTATGFLFVMLGNMLGKVRSNFFMGVRTPWTLSSEYTWTKTNRATGWVMVIGGIAIALCGALFGGATAFTAVMVTVAAMLIVAIGYSYAVWRTAPDRDDEQSDP